MDKGFKNIGDLYKKSFEDFEEKVHGYNWNELEYKLDKKDFWRFSLTGFNIYYLSVIVVSFMASAAVFIDYFFIHSQTEKQVYEIKHISKNDSVHTALPSDNSINQHLKKESARLKSSAEGIVKSKVDSSEKENLIKIDSISQTVVAKQSQDTIQKKKAKQKKVVYLVKKDTVVVFDTVKVKNKKNFPK